LAALLTAFTGVLLLLTGLLLSSALLLTRLLLPSALLLLTRRALSAPFLFVALILRNIFVWISHLNYLMLKFNNFQITTIQLITSYGDVRALAFRQILFIYSSNLHHRRGGRPRGISYKSMQALDSSMLGSYIYSSQAKDSADHISHQ
jgi:hypothetical protein